VIVKTSPLFMNRYFCIVLAALALCSLLTQLSAKPKRPGTTLQAVVTHVTDGDTLWAKPSHAGAGLSPHEAIKIRLEGIDAPEICQAWGEQSKAALAQQSLNQTVTLHLRGHDQFGRWIGKVELHGQDLGLWLIARGHAWSYAHRRRAGDYERAEQSARAAHLGLFSQPSPLQPKLFRKRRSCH
jgi:micrococcal nuclease